MEETAESRERYYMTYVSGIERSEEYWREALRARDDMKLAWAELKGLIKTEEWQIVDYVEIEERYERYWGVKRLVSDDIEMTEVERRLLKLSPLYEHRTCLPPVWQVVRGAIAPGVQYRLANNEANLPYFAGLTGWTVLCLTPDKLGLEERRKENMSMGWSAMC